MSPVRKIGWRVHGISLIFISDNGIWSYNYLQINVWLSESLPQSPQKQVRRSLAGVTSLVWVSDTASPCCPEFEHYPPEQCSVKIAALGPTSSRMWCSWLLGGDYNGRTVPIEPSLVLLICMWTRPHNSLVTELDVATYFLYIYDPSLTRGSWGQEGCCPGSTLSLMALPFYIPSLL